MELSVSKQVLEARHSGSPIVALESTVITHGLPYPANLETAREVENVIREEGAVPATIAVIDGTVHVGLEREQLNGIAAARCMRKLSRSDIAHCIVTGGSGSTTVAATMIIARLAGIRVFATGGIGGVHRGADSTFDVSADLHELARTPVIVVAAGAKAILDLPKTLEVLETLGVPVLVHRSETFPAFWSRDSGLDSPLRVDSVEEIVRIHLMRRKIGLEGGELVAEPIPADDEISRDEIEAAVEVAVAAASKDRVSSKKVTPYLLERVLEATGGRSLAANISLLKNNARLAARIAGKFQTISPS